MTLYMDMMDMPEEGIQTSNTNNILDLHHLVAHFEVAVLAMTKMCQVNTKRHFEILNRHFVVSKHSVVHFCA